MEILEPEILESVVSGILVIGVIVFMIRHWKLLFIAVVLTAILYVIMLYKAELREIDLADYFVPYPYDSHGFFRDEFWEDFEHRHVEEASGGESASPPTDFGEVPWWEEEYFMSDSDGITSGEWSGPPPTIPQIERPQRVPEPEPFMFGPYRD